MQRLLLLLSHTTYKAQSFLDAAARLGVAVTVGTDRRQVLSALHPAGNLTVDFARPEAAAREVAAFARRYPIDAVIAADDEGALVAAHAAAVLGLQYSSVDAVRTARDKHRTREALRAAGLPVPPYWKFRLDADAADIARRVVYPCVLKPLELSASRGVIRADTPEEFVAAHQRLTAILLDRQALADTFMVEGFIPGVEVAVEGVLEGGALRLLALFDKPDPLDGPFFEETIYVTPSRHPQDVQRAIVSMAERGTRALGLRHGPVHAELRCNAQGAWVLEIAPRSIGGLCSRALRFGDAMVSLEELLLRQALDRPTRGLERETRASGVMMVPIPRAGVLRSVRGTAAAAAVPGIDAVQMTIPPGQRVAPPPEGSRYLGFLFARATTADEVEAALRTAHARLDIDIETTASEGGDVLESGVAARPAATRGKADAPIHG
jgi:biotin carboxylase